MISATSVKDRLKNQAASGGKTFQEALIAYGLELKEAVKETFEHRKTGLDDIVAFEDEFAASEIHQSRWNGGECY